MIPENEMGVIVIFAQQCQEAGFEFTSIGSEFPDAIIKRDEKIYRVEFEYKSSNFIQHCHDLRKCDLIICWIDDNPDYFLPTLALSSPDWKLKDIATPDIYKAEIAYWKERALKAEKRIVRPKEAKSFKPKRVTKKEALLQIQGFISNNPHTSLREIGLHIGRPKSTVGNYVNELIQTGKLHKNGEGFKVLK